MRWWSMEYSLRKVSSLHNATCHLLHLYNGELLNPYHQSVCHHQCLPGWNSEPKHHHHILLSSTATSTTPPTHITVLNTDDINFVRSECSTSTSGRQPPTRCLPGWRTCSPWWCPGGLIFFGSQFLSTCSSWWCPGSSSWRDRSTRQSKWLLLSARWPSNKSERLLLSQFGLKPWLPNNALSSLVHCYCPSMLRMGATGKPQIWKPSQTAHHVINFLPPKLWTLSWMQLRRLNAKSGPLNPRLDNWTNIRYSTEFEDLPKPITNATDLLDNNTKATQWVEELILLKRNWW